jgi:eukaryotic-like serine/threonine-protein kinase
MIGTTVGKYRVVEKLGRGGMGTVYKAVDETLDREVAIKVLNPELTDEAVLKRFRAEAVTLARLNHPGIATIYELHQHGEELLMVMEFVRGETFHDLSDRLGPLGPPQAAHLCMQVLDALGHAHRAGVVHRDLKPANVMITESGTVKVMDFGIARVLGSERFTHGGYMMGTPAYMAPEQVLGREIDGRADLYSVGVVLYRLLSGRLPFDAETAISMVQMQISEAPTPIVSVRPDVPRWCSTVLERSLAKAPAERFQSAEEFRAALLAAGKPQTLGEMPTIATPAPPGILIDTDATIPRQTQSPLRTVTSASDKKTPPAEAVATAVVPQVPSAPAPAPAPRPAERASTTVVLERTHLIALAALIVAVATGIAILAVVALKSPSAPPAQTVENTTTIPATSTEQPGSAPAASPAPTATPTPTPPAGSATSQPAPTSPPPAPSTPGAKPGTGTPAGTKDTGVATAGAANTAGRSSTSASTPTDASAAARGGRASNQKDVAPVSAPPPTSAPPPAAVPAAPAVTFNQVRVLISEAGRAREREGVLQLGDGQVSMLAQPGGAAILSIPNGSLSSIFYARSKQPKWRDASGQEVESRIDLGPMGFLRGDRNWIILLTRGEPVILRIEDSALRTVLPALQERTGLTIQR